MTVVVLRALAVMVALAMVWPAATPVVAQQPHWLVGTWDGERKNVAVRNRTGTGRQLVVASVNRDGRSAKARWVTGSATVNVTLAIDGETVTFTTPGSDSNTYRLVHKGDRLEGAWTHINRGNSGAIELFKQ